MMIDLPNFHDGYFDGLWTSENKIVHLFLRTSNGKRSTIVLSDVERLHQQRTSRRAISFSTLSSLSQTI